MGIQTQSGSLFSHKNFFVRATYFLATIFLIIILTSVCFILSMPAYAERFMETFRRIGLVFSSRSGNKARHRAPAASPMPAIVKHADPIPLTVLHKRRRGTKPKNSFSLPLFHDAGAWQKPTLVYLCSSACALVAALYFLPMYAGTASAYHSGGYLVRNPILTTYLDADLLPYKLETRIPLEDSATRPVSPTGPLQAKLAASFNIFRGPAILEPIAALLEDQDTSLQIVRQQAPSGPLHFDSGKVSLQTAAGEIVLTGKGKPDQSLTFPGYARLSCEQDPKKAWQEASLSVNNKEIPWLAQSSNDPWPDLTEKRALVSPAVCVQADDRRRADLSRLLRGITRRDRRAGGATLSERYKEVARTYAEKYELKTSLLLAIMHTESGFNPYAVSPRQAIGLMQIVPHSAGIEVYRFLKGTHGTPSRDVLFNPENNIRYGATYLHLLDRYHFAGVRNKTSRQFCVIAGYNGGPNAVLKHFHRNRDKAIQRINSMTAEQIYSTLTRHFPYAETRRYVESVKSRMETYSTH